jgi:hypothetical protein
MSRALLSLVAAGAFLASLVCIHLARAVPSPDLWTDQPIFDHGRLLQGQQVLATFELVNHFPEPIEILEVITGCACSGTTLSTKYLQPGERVSLKVSWKTGRSRGPTTLLLQVLYKLPDRHFSSKSLQVKGNVLPDIRYDPSEIEFAGNRLETQVLQLAAGAKRDFVILKAFCSHRAFTAEVRESGMIEVTFDPAEWVAEDRSEPLLIVKTNSSNEPQMCIPLAVDREKSMH